MNKYFTIALAALAFVACEPEYDGTDKLPVIPEELSYEGEGSLLAAADGSATGSTYTYSITEEGVEITATLSISDAAAHDGAWVAGYFVLDAETVQNVLGEGNLTDTSFFYPVESNGSKSGDWTSYAPGQWVDANGNATDWSGGHVYFFWETDSDYSEIEVHNAFAIGHNPSNAVAGETITIHCIYNGLPFNITISVVA